MPVFKASARITFATGFLLTIALGASVQSTVMLSMAFLASPTQAQGWRALPLVAADTRITALAKTGSGLYAGTRQGALFASQDDGARWNPIRDGAMLGMPISGIAEYDSVLYAWAGVSNHMPFESPLSECQTSIENYNPPPCTPDPTDGGGVWFRDLRNPQSTWNTLAYQVGTDGLPQVRDITAMAARKDTLIAASSRGFYWRPGRSRGWSPLIGGEFGNRQGEQLPCDSRRYGRNTLVALAWIDSGLYAFTDSAFYAATLRASTGGLAGGSPSLAWSETYMPALCAAAMGRFLLVGTPDGLKRSPDGGKTWQDLGSGPFRFLRAFGRELSGIRGNESLRSSDTGRTWTKIAPDGGGARSLPACILPSGNGYLAGMESAGGIFASAGGQGWEPLGTGLPESKRVSLAVSSAYPGIPAIFQGLGQREFWISDGTQRWVRRETKVPLIPLRAAGGRLFLASDSGLWGADAGENAVYLRDAKVRGTYHAYAAGAGWMAVEQGGILWRCRDGVPACESAMPGLPPAGQGPRLIAARGNSLVAIGDSLSISQDAGSTWMNLKGPDRAAYRMAFAGKRLLGFALPDPDGANLLFTSDDDGATLAYRPYLGMKGGPPYSLVAREGEAYAVTDSGVFFSGGDFSQWSDIGKGLPVSPPYSLALDGDLLAVATGLGQIYVRDLPTLALRRNPAAARGPSGRWRLVGAMVQGPHERIRLDGRRDGRRQSAGLPDGARAR